MAKKKVVKKVAKKAAVKRKVARVVKRKRIEINPDKVFNMDILHYWSTGKKKISDVNDYELISEGDILYYQDGGDAIKAAYQDPSGRILINGDENSWSEDWEFVVERLQKIEGSVTTSFLCFEKAGINLKDIYVLDSQTDLSIRIDKKDPGFKDASKHVPKGATLTNHRNYNKKTNKYTGAIWMKKIHRAGAILFVANDKTYIASMDETQYYIIELCKTAKTLVSAFNTLKPARIRTWEKKNNEEAARQGEWYFIPAPESIFIAEDAEADIPLPMKSDDSNPHSCEEYLQINKKNYVRGNIDHDEHDTLTFREIHEAIENTALNAWSIEGVD